MNLAGLGDKPEVAAHFQRLLKEKLSNEQLQMLSEMNAGDRTARGHYVDPLDSHRRRQSAVKKANKELVKRRRKTA